MKIYLYRRLDIYVRSVIFFDTIGTDKRRLSDKSEVYTAGSPNGAF